MNIQPDQSTDGTVPETELWEKFNGHVNTISDSQIDENGNLVDEEATSLTGMAIGLTKMVTC